MELGLLIFVILIALFIRFAVAVLKGAGTAGSTEPNERVRQAIEAMRPGRRAGPPPPAPQPSYQAPPPPQPSYQAPPPPQPSYQAQDAEDEPDGAQATGILNGPQLVDLTSDQQRRVLEYMDQGYEVMAVRLVCDETRAGILDAQKTVRTLAGLPSPY